MLPLKKKARKSLHRFPFLHERHPTISDHHPSKEPTLRVKRMLHAISYSQKHLEHSQLERARKNYFSMFKDYMKLSSHEQHLVYPHLLSLFHERKKAEQNLSHKPSHSLTKKPKPKIPVPRHSSKKSFSSSHPDKKKQKKKARIDYDHIKPASYFLLFLLFIISLFLLASYTFRSAGIDAADVFDVQEMIFLSLIPFSILLSLLGILTAFSKGIRTTFIRITGYLFSSRSIKIAVFWGSIFSTVAFAFVMLIDSIVFEDLFASLMSSSSAGGMDLWRIVFLGAGSLLIILFVFVIRSWMMGDFRLKRKKELMSKEAPQLLSDSVVSNLLVAEDSAAGKLITMLSSKGKREALPIKTQLKFPQFKGIHLRQDALAPFFDKLKIVREHMGEGELEKARHHLQEVEFLYEKLKKEEKEQLRSIIGEVTSEISSAEKLFTAHQATKQG